MFVPDNTQNRIRWLPVYNNFGSTIPAYGVLSVDIANGSFRENQYMIPVVRYAGPSSTSTVQIMVCGPTDIAASAWGLATFDSPCFTLYDPATGTPAPNQTWGPIAGSFLLRSGRPGFTIIGGQVNLGGSNQARVFAQWNGTATAPLLGKTDAAHNKGAIGTVSVWTGAFPNETDSTVNVSAVNRFANLGSGKWCIVEYVNSDWYLVAGEC